MKTNLKKLLEEGFEKTDESYLGYEIYEKEEERRLYNLSTDEVCLPECGYKLR